MIIPVVYSLNPAADNKMFSWVFCKAISFAKKNNWPVIAQNEYFDSFPNLQGFYSENLMEHFEYEKVSASDLQKMYTVIIPKDIEDAYVAQFPSQTDAFLASIKNPWPQMEKYLDKTLNFLEKQLEEKIEALMVLPNNAFIENIARKRNIPIIHFEWGPFRPKMYRKTAYFDFKNVIGGLEERYQKFREQGQEKQVPLFSRQEILALFLNNEYLRYAVLDRAPIYEVGVAAGYSIIFESSAYNMVSLAEIETRVNQIFPEEEVCWRLHPSDPQNARLHVKNISQKESLVEFILDCKRIVGYGTNEMFEAMLYDRIAYGMGNSHYAFCANRKLEDLEDKKPEIEFLNFVTFCYLIPYELLDNVEYLRFRLSNPSEVEIYNYHLDYYLNTLHIKKEIIEAKDKLPIILQVRGFMPETNLYDSYFSRDIWFECGKGIEENIIITRLKNENWMLKEQKQKLEENVCFLQTQNQKNAQIEGILEKLCSNYLRDSIDIKEENINHAKQFYEGKSKIETAVIYLDYGDGFSEKNKLYVQYEQAENQYRIEFDVPEGVQKIRFDPLLCGERMLYYTDILLNGESDAFEEYNIKIIDDKHTFVEKYPYFVLKKLVNHVEIIITILNL